MRRAHVALVDGRRSALVTSNSSRALSTWTTNGVIALGLNWLWSALESINSLLTTLQVSTLLLKGRDIDRWERRGGVVDGLVLVDLVDWLGGVDDVLLVNILLDHRLDVLMHMVMDMLSGHSRLLRLGNLCWCNVLGVAELGVLALKFSADLGIVAVLDLAGLDALDSVCLSCWGNLLVDNWLDGGVVVLLVDLAVDNLLSLLALGLRDVLVLNSWVDGLVDGGIGLAVAAEEGGDLLLGLGDWVGRGSVGGRGVVVHGGGGSGLVVVGTGGVGGSSWNMHVDHGNDMKVLMLSVGCMCSS